VSENRPIVLFDGVCNLCNGVVRFLYPRDPRARLRFTNLQSDSGQALLEKFGMPTEDFDSFVLVEGDKAYTQSHGALRTLRYLRFPWPLLYGLMLVPPFIRNAVYDWIARNRYGWFGRMDACPVPTPELQARFLA
jgi:predicted DCC family thiol-disulfide oxidoreductase YuxK